jgi:hypothetical protein
MDMLIMDNIDNDLIKIYLIIIHMIIYLLKNNTILLILILNFSAFLESMIPFFK